MTQDMIGGAAVSHGDTRDASPKATDAKGDWDLA